MSSWSCSVRVIRGASEGVTDRRQRGCDGRSANSVPSRIARHLAAELLAARISTGLPSSFASWSRR